MYEGHVLAAASELRSRGQLVRFGGLIPATPQSIKRVTGIDNLCPLFTRPFDVLFVLHRSQFRCFLEAEALAWPYPNNITFIVPGGIAEIFLTLTCVNTKNKEIIFEREIYIYIYILCI